MFGGQGAEGPAAAGPSTAEGMGGFENILNS